MIAGIFGCFWNGVSLDTQFTGGAVLGFTTDGSQIDTQKISEQIEELTGRSVTVQETRSHVDDTASLELTLAGKDGLTPDMQKEITEIVKNTAGNSKVELSQTYAVEPYIGHKALRNAGIAIGLSLLFMVLYVWFRFSIISGLYAGVAALLALLHDVFVVFFAFVLWQIPLNDAFIAVILTIIGYSINDTIVVYDRIRENRRECTKIGVIEMSDISVSQVLARSINTSFTTGICVFTILVAAIIFQIQSIFEFALPMFFGLLSGCYSSICIASLLWAIWEKKKEEKNGI